MQSLRLKFGERRSEWRCCFCCHVRTGTIIFGLYHFLMNMVILSMLAIAAHYPDGMEEDLGPVLPTPLSEIDDDSFPTLRITNSNSDFVRPQPPLPHNYQNVAMNQRDWNISVFFTMCTLAMSMLLLYGAVMRKPAFLMPFFGFQVFNFCITSMAAVGYLCYPPNFQQMINQNRYMPFKHELENVSPQTLSLYAVLALLLAMMVKFYFIGVVWSCYKYLTLRQAVAQRTLQFIENQNLIHDLPDYETAVKKFPTPPPSYATAVLGETDAAAASSSSAASIQPPRMIAASTANAGAIPQGAQQV